MRQYNEIKTKTTQIILPDLNSLTHHIKRANSQAYCWVHCMIYRSVTHVYLVGNVKWKPKLSSLCGMTVINYLSHCANVPGPVHIKEPKLTKQLLLTITDRND